MPNKNLLLPSAIGIAFLLLGFVLYGSAGHDDSHITFWASYTLSEFGEIVNYNGDRIEQSSSLLLTVLTALLAKLLHADVVTTGYVLALLSGAATLILTWQVAELCSQKQGDKQGGQSKISEKRKFYSDPIFAVLILATSPAFLLWNSSGMESTLAALCLLWFIKQWAELLALDATPSPSAFVKAVLATFSLIAVRPEMIALVVALAFTVFVYKRITATKQNLIFYSTLLLCICLLTGFRYFYFGSPLPLPVAAKVSSLSTEKLWFGCYYLLRYGVANISFLIALPIALVYVIRDSRNKTQNWQLILSAFALLAYSVFILVSGGDWMQMGRFLVPILPLAALFCAFHFQRSSQKPGFGQPWFGSSMIAALLLLNFYGNYNTLKQESHGTPIWASYHITTEHRQRYSIFEQYNQEHLRDMDAIDTLDRTITTLLNKNIPALGHPITVLSGQSGMVFFYTAKKYFRHRETPILHFYDSRSLVENSLLKCPLLNDVPRSSQGLYFDFDGFFARQPGLLNDCGIPKPDILYDINDMTRKLPERMAAQGYTLLHKEGGKMLENKSGLSANTLPAVNFVMVRNDLVNDLGQTEIKIIKYHEKPLVQRWLRLRSANEIAP